MSSQNFWAVKLWTSESIFDSYQWTHESKNHAARRNAQQS